MPEAHVGADLYVHVRIIMGIVLGLSVTRLLSGLARIVQHPKRQEVSFIHLGWVAWMLLNVVAWWWWEFRLSALVQWTFPIYFFVIGYAFLNFTLCSLLFPDQMAEYAGYKEFLISRRRWFFGILAVSFAVDVADTLIKGIDYFDGYGVEYPIRIAASIALCVVAMITTNERFHGWFVAVALVYQASWIVRYLDVL
jgi:hypothetical protein